MRHTLIIYARVAVACIILGVTPLVKAQELGATFSGQTKTGVIMTFQLVDTVEMNIQVGTWDGAPAIDTQTQGQVIIPNSAGGMRVVAIAPGAFMGCAGVTAINVPANVASIGEHAFAGMRSLDTLVVSATNAVFDSRNNCNAVIEKATNTLIVGCRGSSIDPTVTAIGLSAFEGSGISNVFLSADITSIGDRAFAGCDSLTTITSLSTSPFAISADCFSNIETVELYVPLGSKATYMATDGWKSIEHIYEIGAPTEVTDEQGVRYVPQYHEGSYIYIVTRLNEIHSAEVTIPSTLNDYPVTAIGDTAFANRTGMTSITIPASVESIGDKAFVGCNQLTHITMLRPEPPTTALTAFDNTDTKTLYVPLGSRTAYSSVEPWSSFTKIEALGAPEIAKIDGVIYTPVVDGDTYTYTISGAEDNISGSLTLRSDVGGYPVTAIAAKAFKDCTGLTGILTLPSSLISIGDLAFMGCSELTSSVHISASVTEIGINPFAGCTGITAFSVEKGNSVYDSRNNSNTIVQTATGSLIAGGSGSQLPDDIKTIAPYAFYHQASLLGITIPENVTSIGEKAFFGCDQITQVRVLAPNPPTIIKDVFSCYDIATLSVVKGCKAAYSGAIGWKEFSHISEIGVPEEYRDGQGVEYTPYETNDTYAYAVTGHQTAMPAKITIPNNINGYYVEMIEANAFKNCKTLSSMTLPENLLYIGDSAFMDCPNMTTVYIPSSTISIGKNAFNGCKHLHAIDIPAATTSIGANAFLGCSALETITVNAYNMIYDARENCNAIIESSTNVLLYGSGSTIIPASVTAIAENAFRGNTLLTSVTIPSGVTAIGANAFNGCNALTVVNCEVTMPIAITEGTFTDLNYLSLNVPLGSKRFYAVAPVWKDFSSIDDGSPLDPDYYQLTYIVEGDTIETCQLIEGQPITPLAYPEREGYTFSGWIELPDSMPAHDVTVSGSFILVAFEIDNMAFNVSGQASEKAVTYVHGPSAEQLTVPSSVSYSGQTYSVTAIADSAFAALPQLKSVKIPSSVKAAGKNLFVGSSHLAAIIWEAPMQMTQEMAGSVTSNPNLLFYTSNTAYAPDGVTNVINSQTKQAERIVLSDAGDGNDFYCPEEFTAKEIIYIHSYQQTTVTGKCQGWESLVLPFDVTGITHVTKGVITPFGALQIGHEFDNGTKPFWLYEYTTGGSFAEADGIKANVPYILSMPNEARLSDEYILAGSITFKGANATVKATSGANAVKSGNYSFTPNYENAESTSAYLLNVGQSYDGNPEGSVFVKGLRKARPFEAYFQLSGSAGVKGYFGVFDQLTDEIRSIEPAKRNGNTEYYQLDGTKRDKLQRGFNIVRTPDGKTQKWLVR